MVKILVGALLVLTAVNTMARNMYIYKDKDGNVVTVNVNPSSSPRKLNRATSNKAIKTTVESGKESATSNPTINYKRYEIEDEKTAAEVRRAIDNLSKYSEEKEVKSGDSSIDSD